MPQKPYNNIKQRPPARWNGVVLNTWLPRKMCRFASASTMAPFPEGFIWSNDASFLKIWLVKLSRTRRKRRARTWKLIDKQCVSLTYDWKQLRHISVLLNTSSGRSFDVADAITMQDSAEFNPWQPMKSPGPKWTVSSNIVLRIICLFPGQYTPSGQNALHPISRHSSAYKDSMTVADLVTYKILMT